MVHGDVILLEKAKMGLQVTNGDSGVGNALPLVSVIIPAYNAEGTLEESVRSVLNQSVSNLELIIINDGSSDSTGNLADRLASEDGRIRVVNQLNEGVSAARNKGMRLAKGRFIGILDADDLWLSDKLATQLMAVQSDENVVVITGLKRFADLDSGREWLNETIPPIIGDRRSYAENIMHLPSSSMNLINTMLVLRDHLLSIGGWNEQLRTGEDWDLWIRLCLRYRFKHLNSVQCLYRKHAASVTRRQDPVWVLGQHLLILGAYRSEVSGLKKSAVISAMLSRMLEIAAMLIYDGRLSDATGVLRRVAGHRQAWVTRRFYIQIKDLVERGLQQSFAGMRTSR